MGDGIKPSPFYQGKKEEVRTVGQYVTELVAYYMAIGMPRELFLDGDDRDACGDYEKAWECKEIYRNKTLHLQGVYVMDAFGVVLANAFSEKGRQKANYLDYPIPTTKAEREAEKQRKIMHTLSAVRNRERKGAQNAKRS